MTIVIIILIFSIGIVLSLAAATTQLKYGLTKVGPACRPCPSLCQRDVRLMADLKPTTRYMVLADIDKSLVFSPDSCKQEDDCEGKMMIKQTSPHRGSRSAWRMTCWRLMTSQRRLVIRLDLQKCSIIFDDVAIRPAIPHISSKVH